MFVALCLEYAACDVTSLPLIPAPSLCIILFTGCQLSMFAVFESDLSLPHLSLVGYENHAGYSLKIVEIVHPEASNVPEQICILVTYRLNDIVPTIRVLPPRIRTAISRKANLTSEEKWSYGFLSSKSLHEPRYHCPHFHISYE